MFWPAVTDAGPLLVTERSTLETLRNVVDELLSGLRSVAGDETVAVLLNAVPWEVPGGMCPMSVKFADAPAGSEAMEQVIVPPEPTAGRPLEQSNSGPLFCVIETNVIVPGSVSVSVADDAAAGP